MSLMDMEDKKKPKKNKKQLKSLFNGQSSLASPIAQKTINENGTSEDLIPNLHS